MKINELPSMATDVLIVGGGAVGMSLAIGLAKLQKKTTLIDIKPAMTNDEKQARLAKRDARVYALNLASLALFRDLGIGIDDFKRRADYTQMQVWQADGRGELNFAKPALTPSLLGSMVEPSVIDDALEQRAGQPDVAPFLTLIHGASVDEHFGIDLHQNGIRTAIKHDGKTTIINAKMLVGADGRGSVVRQLLGIGTDTLNYHQTAICCAIKTEKPHNHTARQAMLPTGTLALLPLADLTKNDGGHWQSVVWTLPTDTAKQYLSLPNELADRLSLASGFEMGRILAIESIASFPLSAQVAKSYTTSNALLIGDAAHGVHPLAGQGLNLGLADVAELLDLIKNRQDFDAHLLRQYERARRGQNALMMHSFSFINYAFAGRGFQKEPFRFIRAEMVNLTGKIRPLMDFFNHKASGV